MITEPVKYSEWLGVTVYAEWDEAVELYCWVKGRKYGITGSSTILIWPLIQNTIQQNLVSRLPSRLETIQAELVAELTAIRQTAAIYGL